MAGLLEVLSNTDWGRKIKEEKDRALAEALANVSNQVQPSSFQPSPLTGIFDLSSLKDLFQPINEEERRKAYKQAALSMIGSVLGGALAKALGAGNEFAAGIVRGGSLIGQNILQDFLEREKAWQDFKNKLATKLIVTNIEYLADLAKDEAKKASLKAYAKSLKETYPKYCGEDGSFDWVGFSREATIKALELGLDPKTTRELQEAFFNASKTLMNLEKAKAQILETLASSALNLARIEETKAATEKARAAAEKTKKETELLGKPTPPKVVIYRSEKKGEKEGGLSPAEERRILDRAIQLAQKDERWLTAETNEERWEIIRDYYNRLKEILGKTSKKSEKAIPETKLTADILYDILVGEE